MPKGKGGRTKGNTKGIKGGGKKAAAFPRGRWTVGGRRITSAAAGTLGVTGK